MQVFAGLNEMAYHKKTLFSATLNLIVQVLLMQLKLNSIEIYDNLGRLEMNKLYWSVQNWFYREISVSALLDSVPAYEILTTSEFIYPIIL